MRAANLTVFDEYVPAASPAVPQYTGSEFDSPLGSHNQIAVQAVIDNVSAAGSFDLFVEHSADGRSWIQKNPPGTSGEISIATLSTSGATNIGYWSDACEGISKPAAGFIAGPLLAFVRFRIVLGTSVGAHVRVFATLRDR